MKVFSEKILTNGFFFLILLLKGEYLIEKKSH